jgi:hypothetical protein
VKKSVNDSVPGNFNVGGGKMIGKMSMIGNMRREMIIGAPEIIETLIIERIIEVTIEVIIMTSWRGL